MNSVIGAIEIKMAAAGCWLGLGCLRIRVDCEIRVARRDGETVSSQVRRGAGKPRVQETGLCQRGKISVRSARGFQLHLGRRNRPQGLNSRSFVSRAYRLWQGLESSRATRRARGK